MSLPTHELLPACRVLFGPDAGVGMGFLQGLHEDLVKQVFRRRAFETHPDRAESAGLDALEMTRRFQEVQAAKELLSQYLAERGSAPFVPPPAAKAPPRRPRQGAPRSEPKREANKKAAHEPPRGGERQSQRQASQDAATDVPAGYDYLWSGALPDRHLPLGEYLFYSKRVSMRALIAAIHAQRVQRPYFGHLAARWGYLRPEAIAMLMASRQKGERLGEAALRFGLLTPWQRDVILGMQRGAQRKFGEYFVETGVLTRRELDELVRAQQRHNFGRAARRAV